MISKSNPHYLSCCYRPLGSRSNSSINVDLWPDGAWTLGELNDLVQTFEELGPTSGQISSQIRGLEPQIIIAFATGAIASGFFAKLGEDLYGLFKTKLKRHFLKGVPKAELRERVPKKILSLSFKYPDSRLMLGKERPELCVYYNCLYSQESQLDSFLTSVRALDNLIHEGHSLRSHPFDVGQAFAVDARLEFNPEQLWNVRILRYRRKTELPTNDFFLAKITSKLDDLKWEQIHWLKWNRDKGADAEE